MKLRMSILISVQQNEKYENDFLQFFWGIVCCNVSESLTLEMIGLLTSLTAFITKVTTGHSSVEKEAFSLWNV